MIEGFQGLEKIISTKIWLLIQLFKDKLFSV